MELLSVIVAIYNVEPWLECCVRSILEQTYTDLEILLVDDGSTDGCPALCDRFAREDPRVRVIHKENGGLSDARNAGIDAATGTYIAFVDGDDWIDAPMYQEMITALREEGADLCACSYKQIRRDGVKDDSTGKKTVWEGQDMLMVFLLEKDEYQIQNAAWNKVYKRELIGDLRFPKGKLYEDIVYTTILLSRIKKGVYLDRAFYNYVIDREGSIMNRGIRKNIFTDQIPAYEEKEAFLRKIGRDDLADVHRYFFYKRLLIYYRTLHASKDPDRKKYCAWIRQRLKQDEGEMGRVYSCPGASPNEYKKMKIFLRSATLYRMVMWINEKVILPVKTRRRQ
ncbi:MAG TPA: glycosyltransferase [Candidatus Eisenbergiella merdipullorum]|uniref:Glycosyltransferase n=1 Tax=Candidatus Eisenbergiella merdipullorum TaxID=2838553 RepID=A0A9D2L009_9FIRM|nr:glycosyltransferase [Candidatus Eisenbergiella merdipullorum]